MILITRPEPQASDTVSDLQTHDLTACASPVLHIHPQPGATEALTKALKENPVAIMATSKHALPVLSSLPRARALPLIVIGSASRHRAETLGFSHILQAEGNAPSLVEHIITHLNPEDGALLYARGQNISLDIKTLLEVARFTVEEVTTYYASPTTRLPERIQRHIRQGDITVATAYSVRSLKALEALLHTHDLSDHARHITLACFSSAIAEEASPTFWRKAVFAASPTEDAMLALFKHLCVTS